jgi:UPF0755 protein
MRFNRPNSALRNLLWAGVFVVGLTLFLRAINSGPSSAPDFESGMAGAEVIIEVMPGESGSQIAEKLQSNGVVKSALAFFRVAVSDERSKRIAPGEHRVQTKIPAREALIQLLDPERIPNLVKVRDGARWLEVRAALIDFGFTAKQLDEAYTAVKLSPPFSNSALEGFLYPAQYSFNSGISATNALQQMIDKFFMVTSQVEWSSVKEFSPNEIMTIAALVEAEGTPVVFDKVARVVFNRLKLGMPLQFDATVNYVLQRRGEIRVSLKETKLASSYNTYLNRGLPPGPIGSPTLSAIQATLKPAVGDWLYFVTVKPGDTQFTKSYDEFLSLKALYKRNLKAGLFE